MMTTLKKPEFLQFPCAGTGTCFGCDQEWFPGFWQRKAGCGPCTGANLLLYLARTNRLTLPLDVKTRADFISLMEITWKYLTPTMMGLNSVWLMQKGLDTFFLQRNINLKSRVLDIPADTGSRPQALEVETFIKAGLLAESPVAFLNLSNGGIKGLDSWHWVTVVGMSGTGEETQLLIYDNGHQIRVDLALWLRATTRGGGFVYADTLDPHS